jgi:phospholipase D1/2
VIGKAIVDAVVKAGKENRKFRIIIVIPAIPGFAGDLREDAATGTRAIMDYQYKSILRGEHSIFERVKAEGVDPTREYIYAFWETSTDPFQSISSYSISGLTIDSIPHRQLKSKKNDPELSTRIYNEKRLSQ